VGILRRDEMKNKRKIKREIKLLGQRLDYLQAKVHRLWNLPSNGGDPYIPTKKEESK
jgi:hypothetical protein